MPDYYPPVRQLPSGFPSSDGAFERPASDSVSLGQIFGVLRRRYRLVLLLTLVGLAAGGYLAAKTPATYRATATIRLAGERQALTGEIETPAPELPRTADPLLSLAQLVRSYSVIGAVVDTLGLQLTSLTPEFGTARLDQVWVNPQARGDTIQVTFYQNGVKARAANRESRARYGERLDLGIARFTVTSVPDVPSATLYVVPREVASDQLLGGLVVTPRAGTDVIDIIYTSGNPRRAQRVVNTTVSVFKQLSILNAKEKSSRRRQFLETQLKQTDSMLARSQAELASFRSRQQLANTQDALNAQQSS